MDVEAISHGWGTCSWRYRLLANLLVGVIYTAMAASAVGVGVWAGSRASLPRPDNDRSLVRRSGEDARPRVASVSDILAGARLPADHAPIGFIEIDGKSFTVLVDQTGAVRVTGATSGGGFADVFDHEGHLLRRYAAIEYANSSWELMEYTRLPADSESRINHGRNSPRAANDLDR
jgi:hypothetical protein